MKTTILTLAIALAFSFTAVPADAGLTEGQKCAMKANLLSGKFSLCLNKADANVSKGRLSDTAAADAKCETKFRDGWGKTRSKAAEKDASLGADCDGAMSDAVRDSVEASSLIAAGTGRDLAAFAVSEDDLDDDSGIKSLVFDLTYEWTLDAYGDGCEAAGGSWESGTCTAVSSYNCTIGAMCSAWAAEYPDELEQYTNNYINHTAATSGCAANPWSAVYNAVYPISQPLFYSMFIQYNALHIVEMSACL